MYRYDRAIPAFLYPALSSHRVSTIMVKWKARMKPKDLNLRS